jgi:hypothetical protein
LSIESQQLVLIAGIEPSKPSVYLTVQGLETATCEWVEPFDNGFEIMGYYVSIRTQDGPANDIYLDDYNANSYFYDAAPYC